MTVSRLPHDTTMLFCNVWEDAETFSQDYKDSGLYNDEMDDHLATIFYLLYAKHANSAIVNWDVNQFKYKVYAIIYQYGPTWAKRVEIQKILRGLEEQDIVSGNKAIYNHSYNPSTEPSTSSLEELPTINEQNTNNMKRGLLEAYGNLAALLETDVTEEFLARFKPLFAKFVYTKPDLFVTYLDEEEEDDQ